VVAGMLGSINFGDVDALDKFTEALGEMNIELNKDSLDKFIKGIKELKIAVETVDLKKMSSLLQGLYDIYAGILSGEQGRTFSQDAYEKLINANSDLANKFVQVGEVFKYVGGSINDLANSFALESIRQSEIAKEQLKS
jgi:polyhydroxyalkanoate synthesis regulator phasin